MRVHLFWFGAQQPERAPAPMLPCQKMDTENAPFFLYYCAQILICAENFL